MLYPYESCVPELQRPSFIDLLIWLLKESIIKEINNLTIYRGGIVKAFWNQMSDVYQYVISMVIRDQQEEFFFEGGGCSWTFREDSL